MGLVKTRRLAAMHKQQRAKAGMKPPKAGDAEGHVIPSAVPNAPPQGLLPAKPLGSQFANYGYVQSHLFLMRAS